MYEENKKLADDIGSSAKTAVKSAKAARKALHFLSATATTSVGPVVLIVIACIILVFFILIPAASSISQFDDVLHLSALGEEINMPDADELESSLWDKEYAQKDTIDLLKIIEEKTSKNKEDMYLQVASYCKAHGYDISLSWNKRRDEYETNYMNDASSNSDEVTQVFEMDDISSDRKKSFPLAEADTERSTAITNIFQSDKTFVDKNGLYRYKSSDDSSDYIVALGSYYGKIGNRYKITFTNGESITLLKAYDIDVSETFEEKGKLPKESGIFHLLCSLDKIPVSLRETMNAKSLSTFTKVEKIELIESELSSGTSTVTTGSENRILAAYSVYLNNAQLEKKETLGKTDYYNQKGDLISRIWFWAGTDEIDYEKVLTNRLNDFLKNGSFYTVDYERENGKIKVYSEVRKEDATVRDEASGENVSKKDSKKENSSENEKTEVVYYVIPILIEKDINSIAEEIFDIDPNAPYVNSGGLYEKVSDDSEVLENINGATNEEAINTIAEFTASILFDQTFSSNEIIASELSGEYAWPVPSSNYVSSPFGMRIHPVYHVRRMHTGVDIACSEGSQIIAAGDGVVSFVGWNGGYGKYIKINHGNGIETAYAHLSAYGVQKGQNVSKGQLIAKSGNTGTSTGGHLHFEVLAGGSYENPLNYVTTAETYKKLTIAGKS